MQVMDVERQRSQGKWRDRREFIIEIVRIEEFIVIVRWVEGWADHVISQYGTHWGRI